MMGLHVMNDIAVKSSSRAVLIAQSVTFSGGNCVISLPIILL